MLALKLFCVLSSISFAKLLSISECPHHNVKTLRNEADNFELSFLFYYVSWSRDARQARSVYDEVAQYYNNQAYFAAIDCWHLHCNCSKTHAVTVGTGAPHKWPTLIVRYGRQLTLEYPGNWKFEDLSTFMNDLLQPFDRVHSKIDLKALSVESDAVVLAFFENANCLQYRQFAAAAVQWLEFDVDRYIRFAVSFGPSSMNIMNLVNVTLPYLIMTDTGHKIEVFNSKTNNFNSSDIVRWVQMSLKNVFLYTSSYRAPWSLAQQLRKGSVLALSVNPLPFNENFFTLMSDVIGTKQSLIEQYSRCESLWREMSSSTENQISKIHIDKNKVQDRQILLTNICPRIQSLSEYILSNYYTVNDNLNSIYSHNVHYTFASIYSSDSTDTLLLQRELNKCIAHPHNSLSDLKIKTTKLLQKISKQLWLQAFPDSNQNRSLSVILLDTEESKDLLIEHDIILKSHSAADVFIVDPGREAVYEMHEPFTFTGLISFVKNYYANNLHYIEKSESILSFLPSAVSSQYIQNYNRQLLLQALQLENVTNVVLLYTPQCELSAVMSQSFVQLSALLKGNEIRFLRLNTHLNNLPWELVMPKSPAVVVFPQSRSLDSRVFPEHLKANVRNLLGFILAQLEPDVQVRLVLRSCSRTRHVEKCLEFAKTLVMQHIGLNLKHWQLYEDQRYSILQHLKNLKELSLNIQSSFKF